MSSIYNTVYLTLHYFRDIEASAILGFAAARLPIYNHPNNTRTDVEGSDMISVIDSSGLMLSLATVTAGIRKKTLCPSGK